MTPPARLARAAGAVVALLLLFGGTALFRFLLLARGFTNDQFIHLANAQQMLFGEWPTRDFLDAGMPLMYVASATAQLVLGRTLFAEAMLVALAFGLAAVLTAAAVRELTGSLLLALAAAALEVAIVPREYGYPKILVYAAAFLLLQRYVTRPGLGRLFALALAVAMAFLFRHDHGIYLAIGGVIAAWLGGHASGRAAARRAAIFVSMVALLTAPYVAYVQIYGGVWAYLQRGLEFREREFARAPYVLPSLAGDSPIEAALFYQYWAFPIAAAVLLVAARHRDEARTLAARVTPLIVVGLLVNLAMLRPSLSARLPDAVVPVVMLAAWVCACAWRARRRWAGRPIAAAAGVVLAVSIVHAAGTADQLERARLLRPMAGWMDSVLDAESALLSRFSERMIPSRTSASLLPFYAYVGRCTAPHHRVLVVGYIPEAPFFLQRAFAGGQAILFGGYFEAERYQRSVLRKLKQEVVPFVLISGEGHTTNFDTAFPLVAGHVRERYEPMATFTDDVGRRVHVVLDPALPVRGRDAATGWPCLR